MSKTVGWYLLDDELYTSFGEGKADLVINNHQNQKKVSVLRSKMGSLAAACGESGQVIFIEMCY